MPRRYTCGIRLSRSTNCEASSTFHLFSRSDTDYFCESFRFDKSVDNGELAQIERLLQFGRVLSRYM